MFCEEAVGRMTAHLEEGNDAPVLTFIAYEIASTRSAVLGIVDFVWKCLRFVKDNPRSQSPEVELNDQGQFLLWGNATERDVRATVVVRDAPADAFATGLAGAELDALTARISCALITRCD
jgi:hypothetical protein